MSRMLIFALAAGLSIQVVAQQSSTPDLADADFLKKAAEAGMLEVELGRLAMEKASDADVKAYARRVVVDHFLINEEILKLSQSRNVALDARAFRVDLTLPLDVDRAAMHATTAHLMTLEGAAFDRAFIDHMVTEHQASADLFDEEASRSKDNEFKDWAEKAHRSWQDHLELAQDLQEQISR